MSVRTSKHSHVFAVRWFIAAVIGVFIGGCTWILFAFFATGLSALTLERGALRTSASFARLGHAFLAPISQVTFHHFSEIDAWSKALELSIDAVPVALDAQTYLPTAFHGDSSARVDAQFLLSDLQTVRDDANSLTYSFQHSFLFVHIIPHHLIDRFMHIRELISDVAQVAPHLLTGEHRYMIVFQNSEELRPTGGFMGSYAVLQLHDGVLERPSILDIYQADGQLTTQLPSPPGVQEYLSAGRGWRLADANWSPDFPTSAQNILQMMTLAHQPPVEGVIAINLSIAEDILRNIGPLTIPDYHLTVTAENFSTLARSDRNTFFPGSYQKSNFLNAVLTQMILRIEELDFHKRVALALQLIHAVQQKEVQLYSLDPTVQAFANKYALSGALLPDSTAQFFFESVEANVGINKANRNVNRTITLTFQPQTTRIDMVIENQNHILASADGQPTHPNGYADYHRFFFPATWQVKTITIRQDVLTHWDEQTFTTGNGVAMKQVGFVVTVAEDETTPITVELQAPSGSIAPQRIQLFHQSGTGPTQYTVTSQHGRMVFTLDKDTLVNL